MTPTESPITIARAKEGHVLTCDLTVHAPRDVVFEFFANAENLNQLTPATLNFRITSPLPIEMRKGALIDYALKVHGMPLRWQSEITVWDPPYKFVDEQRRGPYKFWRHEHSFEEAGNSTRVLDRVEYKTWCHPIVHPLFVAADLRKIFTFRTEQLALIFPQA